jgi:CRISPR-associated protein Cmr4
MNTLILGLLAETAVHPGAGQSAGIIDLPVAREAATDYPVITGSSLKGALASFAREQAAGADADAGFIFGKSDNAGALLVSDARLLLLPVRSLDSACKWVTCPHLLERWRRDITRVGGIAPAFPDLAPERGKFLGASTATGSLFLEERQFAPTADSGGATAKLTTALAPFVAHADTRERLPAQLVILHDDDFAWFARYGLGVQARNVLKKDTKESESLWYEEFIPADALFYAVLAERAANATAAIEALFKTRPYLQLGGNETVGMGWFAVSIANAGNAAASAEGGAQ